MYFSSVFAYTQIEVVNYSQKPLNIALGNLFADEKFKYNENNTYKYILENNTYKYILENEQKKYFTPSRFIIIENKNVLSFMLNGITCAFTHFFGTYPMPHGKGVNVFLNDEYKGTICANKSSVLDFKYNIKLTFQTNLDSVDYIQIINNGWWINEDVYPKILTIQLE